jgi:WD40 repeat protein
VWDTKTAQMVNSLAAPKPSAALVAFDDTRALWKIPGKLESLQWWDLTRGKLISTLNNPGDVNTGDWSLDGLRVLTGGPGKTITVPGGASKDTGTIKLWDAATGKLLRAFDVDSAISHIAISPNGAQLAERDYGGVVSCGTLRRAGCCGRNL